MKLQSHYDLIYLTNTPSFYKVNLCNEIAKNHSVLLVFYGYGAEAVNVNLDENSNYKFDYVFLWKGDSNSRNKLIVFTKLLLLMRKLNGKKIIFEGWFVPEYNVYSFFSPKLKNAVLCESTGIESRFNGLKGWIKKCIISRMTIALPSGKLHRGIFESINFKGIIIETKGVGIFNKKGKRSRKELFCKEKRFLYVGRLIEVKNLVFLIKEFNKSGRPLTIVGKGVLEEYLKSIAKPNISFEGFVNNEELPEIYQQHDVFILPSKSEPWGLVIDEAIYWGLPVVVSNCVGCQIEMVKEPQTGVVFELDNEESFNAAIDEIDKNYEHYKINVDLFSFDERDKIQIAAYTQLINLQNVC